MAPDHDQGRRFRIPAHVADRIQADPHTGKPLRDELAGQRSLTVSRFRIVYRISSRNNIEIVTVGPRRLIYQETCRLLRKRPPPRPPAVGPP